MGARAVSPVSPALEHDPRGSGRVRALEPMRLRFAAVCEITIRGGRWHAGRGGLEVSADTAAGLTQAILIAWGAR